jgi:hypothetical protein
VKKYREPWIERTLLGWAAWVIEWSRWVGWGGGADDPLADAGWARGRTPGSYGNPTQAEAALHQRWAGVHAEIMGLPLTERRVLVARYCGQPVQVERIVDPDIPLAMRRPEKIVGARHIEMRWSGGPLPFATIAALLGLAQSTCHDAMSRGKLRLEMRLDVRRAVLAGLFSPDGVIDPAKLEHAREATHRGQTWKEQQEQEERDAA